MATDLKLRVKPDELKHEFSLSERALIIRWYRLIWGKDARLTFCALFWGTLLSPLVGFALLVGNVFAIWPFKGILKVSGNLELLRNARKERRRVHRRAEKQIMEWGGAPPARRRVLYKSRIAVRVVTIGTVKVVCKPATVALDRYLDRRSRKIELAKTLPQPPPTRRAQALDGIGIGTSWLLVKAVAGIDWLVKRAKRPVKYAAKSIMQAGLIGAGVTAFTIIAYHALHASAATWLIIGAIVGGVLLVTGIIVGLYAMHRAKVDSALARMLAPVLAAIGGTIAFGAKLLHAKSLQAFILSYRAVKTNTCPRIVIEEEARK